MFIQPLSDLLAASLFNRLSVWEVMRWPAVALDFCIKSRPFLFPFFHFFSASATVREFRLYYNDSLKLQSEPMSLEIYIKTHWRPLEPLFLYSGC